MLTVTSLQNARRTPGDSARLTRVELSEKATTSPTTANAPSVLALNVRRRVSAVMEATQRFGSGGTLEDGLDCSHRSSPPGTTRPARRLDRSCPRPLPDCNGVQTDSGQARSR